MYLYRFKIFAFNNKNNFQHFFNTLLLFSHVFFFSSCTKWIFFFQSANATSFFFEPPNTSCCVSLTRSFFFKLSHLRNFPRKSRFFPQNNNCLPRLTVRQRTVNYLQKKKLIWKTHTHCCFTVYICNLINLLESMDNLKCLYVTDCPA